jgi:ketosteroid isomerase-like protein
MKKNEINENRRSFFLKGSVALGAGLVSASAGAATLFDSSQTVQEHMDQLQQKLSSMEDREALKHLHLTFTTLIENRAYDSVAELFSEDAVVELSGKKLVGKAGVKKLFMDEYKGQKISAMHTAHRRDQSQKQDQISVNKDSKHAYARFYNQVLICKPIRGQSVLAEMTRQQGMTAQSYWENGCYDIAFTRINARWRISELRYKKV